MTLIESHVATYRSINGFTPSALCDKFGIMQGLLRDNWRGYADITRLLELRSLISRTVLRNPWSAFIKSSTF